MAPLAPNLTDRYFLDYTSAGYPHTLAMRTDGELISVDAGDALHEFLTLLSPALFQINVTGFRYQAAGTDFSVPVTWGHGSTYGGAAPASYNTAMYVDFVGRTANGHRSRVRVFGAGVLAPGSNYRATAGENGAIDDAREYIRDATQAFFGIDGLKPTWYPYANTGVDAYWRNKVR